MTRTRLLYFALGLLAVSGMGAVTNQVAPVDSRGVALDATGIRFADGSIQTTAVTPPAAAWPMSCWGFVEEGSLTSLTCSSTLPVPGGSFSQGDGVPAGYFFLVTDVMIQPDFGASQVKGFISTDLIRREGSTYLEVRNFKLRRELQSQRYSFHSPLFILDVDDNLAAFNKFASTNGVFITVSGYLSAEPEKLRL